MANYPPSIYGVWQDDPAAPALQAAHADWYGGTEKAAQEAVTEASERDYEISDVMRGVPTECDITIVAGDPTAIERQRQRRNRIAEGFAFALAENAHGAQWTGEGLATWCKRMADALIAELDK
jgi:hypothetical protein